LEVRKREFILMSVGELHVTNGASQLLDLSSDAFIAFCTNAGRPFDGGVATDAGFPIFAHAAEIVGEDETGAAAVGPMNNDEIRGRKLQAGIKIGDTLIIPFEDFAEIDVCDGGAVELEFGITRQVVSDNDCSSDGREV